MLFNKYCSPLIVIVGPTAVGKTEISIQLAESMHAEIVSADSRLFYRGMDIGTAKPTIDERKRVTHHLIDVVYPDDEWNLAIYKYEAHKVIKEIQSRNILPFLVGGSGQYIRAIVEGWVVPEQNPDFILREVLEKWADEIGAEELHSRLTVIDPEAAKKIEHRNKRRTIRALEVIFHSGVRFSAQRRREKVPFSILQIGLRRPREELYTRIDTRINQMISAGFLNEVQSLLANGLSPDLPALSAIGYREMIQFIRAEISMEEAVSQMKRLSRKFVRRQANWFKNNDPAIKWFDASDHNIDEIIAYINSGEGWQRADC
ncbi:MAG: tRNA (adenosine(37)-N6)-dimethylallyltransferase MiaA [Anaerolineaceae bacterium]|nr:tRNA (adenosine(37)-N6)-dimethylallyltransferase MiaA [Anaerolineaceae bacterium]